MNISFLLPEDTEFRRQHRVPGVSDSRQVGRWSVAPFLLYLNGKKEWKTRSPFQSVPLGRKVWNLLGRWKSLRGPKHFTCTRERGPSTGLIRRFITFLKTHYNVDFPPKKKKINRPLNTDLSDTESFVTWTLPVLSCPTDVTWKINLFPFYSVSVTPSTDLSLSTLANETSRPDRRTETTSGRSHS